MKKSSLINRSIAQIERHNFSIIASDSFNVRNSTFDTLISNAGERYDFILEANQNIGDYWIRVKGIGLCATNPIESYALIRYFNENVADIAKYKEILKGLPIAEMPYHHDPFVSHTVSADSIVYSISTCFLLCFSSLGRY